MTKKQVETGLMAVATTDERRTISELNLTDCSVQEFHIKNSPKPLGQHFHRDRTEIFSFTTGGGTVKTAEVNDKGEVVGEIKTIEVVPGTVIMIPPMHAHRFDLKPDTHFIGFASRPFNQNDLIPCPL